MPRLLQQHVVPDRGALQLPPRRCAAFARPVLNWTPCPPARAAWAQAGQPGPRHAIMAALGPAWAHQRGVVARAVAAAQPAATHFPDGVAAMLAAGAPCSDVDRWLIAPVAVRGPPAPRAGRLPVTHVSLRGPFPRARPPPPRGAVLQAAVPQPPPPQNLLLRAPGAAQPPIGLFPARPAGAPAAMPPRRPRAADPVSAMPLSWRPAPAAPPRTPGLSFLPGQGR